MPKTRISHTLLLLIACAGGSTAHAEDLSPNIMNPDAIIAGRDYEVIGTSAPATKANKLEVIEAFSFACPHCNQFEPILHGWSQGLPHDVSLTRLPVVFGREPWRLLAKAHYVGAALGIGDKIGAALFKALHVDHSSLADEDAVAGVFVAQGAKREKVLELLRSDKIAEQVKTAEATATAFKVTGVPTLIVAGKYQTSASMAGDYQRLLKVVDQLLEQERSAAR
jgi:protein dithiol oxidoreductase (disulfide-forming)